MAVKAPPSELGQGHRRLGGAIPGREWDRQSDQLRLSDDPARVRRLPVDGEQPQLVPGSEPPPHHRGRKGGHLGVFPSRPVSVYPARRPQRRAPPIAAARPGVSPSLQGRVDDRGALVGDQRGSSARGEPLQDPEPAGARHRLAEVAQEAGRPLPQANLPGGGPRRVGLTVAARSQSRHPTRADTSPGAALHGSGCGTRTRVRSRGT